MKLEKPSARLPTLAIAWVLGASLLSPSRACAAAPGTELWHYRTGAAIWASPTYAQRTLYVANDAGELIALDTQRRQPRWRFKAGGAIRSQPAVAGDRLFIASDDGYLYALALQDGRTLWRFELRSQGLCRRVPAPDNPFYDYLQSSPVIDQGTVYVGAANGALYAVDAEGGTLRWKVGTGDAVRGSPRIANGRVYFGSWDGHVYALDAVTGKLAWRQDTDGIVQGTPAIVSGTVIVGSRSARLLALAADTGKPAWVHEYKDGSWVESSAVASGSQILIGSSDSLKLSSFDTATGQEQWSYETGGWTWATPVVSGDTVYVGSISATPYYVEGITLSAGFHAVDRRTGERKWRFYPQPVEGGYITGGVMASPAVGEGVVYVAALDGTVYALSE